MDTDDDIFMGHSFLRVTLVKLNTNIHQLLQAWSSTKLQPVLYYFSGSSTLTRVYRDSLTAREQEEEESSTLVTS